MGAKEYDGGWRQALVGEINGPLNLDSRLVVLGAELTKTNNSRLRRGMLSKCPTTKWTDRVDIKAGKVNKR